jgi:hypothetical protein
MVHTPPRARPVEVSDAEFRSAMLMAALHWPITLDPGLALAGGRLRLASAVVEPAGQRSLLQNYARYCERRGAPGDCYRLLEDGPALDAKDMRSIALRIALAQALQLAFETLSDINAEAVKATLVTAIAAYVAMWLLPEPISKAAALAFTAAMIAYVGTDVFWAIRDGFAELKANLEAARTFDDVSAAGDLLGQRLGPSVAKVIVLLASFAAGGALAKMPVPKLPGGPGAVANATSQGLVLSSLQSITVVPGSLTFAVGATSSGGLLMMGALPEGGGQAGHSGAKPAPQPPHALPAWKEGEPVRGWLHTEKGSWIELRSGAGGGPAALPLPGRNNTNFFHVEAHTAQVMRTEGAQQATLLINKAPCAVGPGCANNLPAMLPPGARLRVVGPDGYDHTFVGALDPSGYPR